MSKDTKDNLFIAIITLLLVPFVIVFRAYIVTDMWTWFIEPLGMPQIGIAHAAGILVIIAFSTHQYKFDGTESYTIT